jgi:hypothetical protein
MLVAWSSTTRRTMPAEEGPRRIEPGADVLDGLREAGPDELVAAARQRHDERPEPPPRAVDDDVAHESEVDLGLVAGRRVVKADGDRALAPAELVVREATQRRVADVDAVAREQFVDAHEAQRPLVLEPRLDALPMALERIARVGRRCERARLHALRDLRDDAVRTLALLVEAARLGRADVAHHRLPVGTARARDPARALPRLPAAEDFSNIVHAQLPKAHRHLPTAARTVVERHLALLSVVETGSAERRVGWPHDPGDRLAP